MSTTVHKTQSWRERKHAHTLVDFVVFPLVLIESCWKANWHCPVLDPVAGFFQHVFVYRCGDKEQQNAGDYRRKLERHGKKLGMGSVVETLCGQAYCARKYDMLGIYLQRSTILLMATAIPFTILYAFSRPLLLALGESTSIATAASIYVYGLIPQIFAYATNFPIQKFL